MSVQAGFKGTVAERFAEKTEQLDNGCTVWTAYVSPDGYARFWTVGRKELAHRYAYEQARGPIPEGLDLDHLCRNRRCVNPDHLEAVTRSVNLRRGIGPQQLRDSAAARTHCKQGHPYNEANTRWRTKRGYRYRECRACRREAEA